MVRRALTVATRSAKNDSRYPAVPIPPTLFAFTKTHGPSSRSVDH